MIELYSDERMLKLFACCYKPDWMQISHNELMDKIFCKAKLKRYDFCLLINLTKKTKNHYNINNGICIAIAKDNIEKEIIQEIYNQNNELFDKIMTVNEFIKWINKLMKKFDKIIMNPPYGGSLHLKILEAVLNKLQNDGKCINLSPIRWLQDPLAKNKKGSDYKKFKDSIVNHIKDIEIIDSEMAKKFFGVSVVDLGIYTLTPQQQNLNLNTFENSIVNKLIEFAKKDNVMNHSTKEGFDQTYTGFFGIITSHLGDLNRWVSLDKEMWTKIRYNNTTKVIQFNEQIEIENFFNSLLTNFFKYYAKLIKKNQRQPWQFVPWMGDCINPRTKKKGYLSDWIDEDFYQYFGITKEEQMIIKKVIEK